MLEFKNPKINILVKQTNWLGDSIIALPAMSALRRKYPEAHITVLIKANLAELYENSPYVDEVMPYKFDPGRRGITQKLGLISELRKRKFDLAVLFPNSFESALWAFMARIPKRLGYSRDGRRMLLTNPVSLDKEIKEEHQVGYYMNIVQQLGADVPDEVITFPLPDKSVRSAREKLARMRSNPDAPLVAFAPGAMFGIAKEWFPERFCELGEALRAAYGVEIVFLGTGRAVEISDKILMNINAPAFSLCGQTDVAELAAILKESVLFVGSDSGAAHLAGALGVTTVVLFGSTEPLLTAPIGKAVNVITSPAECRPCFERVCPRGDNACWDAITVDEVMDIIKTKCDILGK